MVQPGLMGEFAAKAPKASASSLTPPPGAMMVKLYLPGIIRHYSSNTIGHPEALPLLTVMTPTSNY